MIPTSKSLHLVVPPIRYFTSLHEIRMADNISNAIPIFAKYLNDVNLCLNLFKELESNRTWGDWIVGDRGKILTERLLEVTNEFKEKLEKLLSIYTTLSSDIEWGKKMELGYQRRSIFQLDYFKDESIAKQLKDLSSPKSIPKVDNSRCKQHTCKLKTTGYVAGGAVAGGVVCTGTIAALAITGGIVLVPAGIGLVIGAIAAFRSAQYNINSGRERGVNTNN